MQPEYLDLWWYGHSDLPLKAQLAWLEGQRLLALLAERAKQKGWDIPAPLTSAARQARYRTAARQALVIKQLTMLGQVAQHLDIPIISVKGLAVAQTYPDAALRPANDIDLLVPETAAADLVTALKAQGYTLTVTGQRGWHLPPLTPPQAGLRIEVHTALWRAHGTIHFTYEEWRDTLSPWESFPGLWLPDPVQHWVYLVAHAFVSHGFDIGLLPLADFKFWTASWDAAAWQRCAAAATNRHLSHAVSLALALTEWFWDEPWAEVIRTAFPAPPAALLENTKRILTEPTVRKLPRVWRDLEARDWRSWLRYISIVLFGDPAVRVGLTPTEKLLFFLRRPAAMIRNHGRNVQRLLRRSQNADKNWQAQKEVQTWLAER